MLFRKSKVVNLLSNILAIFIVTLSACGGTSNASLSPTNTSTSQLQLFGNGHKLFVFLSGFTSDLTTAEAAANYGYGSDPDFFSPGHIQPYLQTRFPGSYFLTFSYNGFNSEGKPFPYACSLSTDSNIADLTVGLYMQITNFLRSHPETPDTNVYIIGHSLGGVIAFSFLATMIAGKNNMLNTLPNGGILKGIFTLDAPIGGLTSNWLYTMATNIWGKNKCNDISIISLPIVNDLNDLFKSAKILEALGASASVDEINSLNLNINNQSVALDAIQYGITIATFGNTNDYTYEPGKCDYGITQNFLSTQWLQEAQSGRNQLGGAIYAREISTGLSDCMKALNSNMGNHLAVLTDPGIQTAIWQIITGQAPNTLIPVPVLPTPTPTPTPTIAPTQSPVPASLPGITPFVGKWWIADGARIMIINPDGSATYTEGSSQEAMIQFNRIEGNTAYGVVIGGTGFMPNGSNITVTLVGTNLQVSDGMLLCPSTDQCAN